MKISVSNTGEVNLPAALDGDVPAFGRVIKSYDGQMRAVAYRMLGSQSAMDDALQDAYLKAFRSLNTFRGDSRFATWLYRIVWRTCIDHLRKQTHYSGQPLEDLEDPHTVHSFEDRVISNARVLEALNTLTPEQRAVLILIDGEGFNYQEAAEILEIELGTASSRISRARANLRSALESKADTNDVSRHL